jgi:hypothetical protein
MRARHCATTPSDPTPHTPWDPTPHTPWDPTPHPRCVHNNFDPREFGVDPSELTCHCGKHLKAAMHLKDPDGIQRNRFAATTNGSLGLTKLITFGAPECMTSLELECDGGHVTPSHAPAILEQLDKLELMQDVYPCQPCYCEGVQMHVTREVSMVAEPLYEESPATLSGITSAIDESLARRFETSAERYHRRRRDVLAPLSAEAAVAAAAELPCLDETMRKRLYGVAPSDGVLSDRVEAQLVSDTSVRADELRSLTIEGELLHVCADMNEPLAKAVQVMGNHDLRKLMLYATAQTGQILSVVLTPDATFQSSKQSLDDVLELHGAPRIYSIDNLPTNAKELAAAMPKTALTTDHKHYYARLKNTMNSYSQYKVR